MRIDQDRAFALNSICPGFVHRFTRFNVTSNFVIVQDTDIDIGNSRVFYRLCVDDHDTGDDLMPLATEAFEDVTGILRVSGFADNFVIEDNNGVCADDKMSWKVFGNVQCFGARDGDGIIPGAEFGVKNFFYRTWDDFKIRDYFF